MLNAIIKSVVVLNDIMLSVVMLSAMVLSGFVPDKPFQPSLKFESKDVTYLKLLLLPKNREY